MFVPADKPMIILVIGVNGAGKTTFIGKLAARFRAEKKKVIVAAGDTFRAGAIDQLKLWAERTGAEFVGGKPGGDAAAVAFDAIDAAHTRDADVVIVDTAGRLHTSDNLMEELKKIARVIKKRHDRPERRAAGEDVFGGSPDQRPGRHEGGRDCARRNRRGRPRGDRRAGQVHRCG
jgi:signal recognition particle GTPase